MIYNEARFENSLTDYYSFTFLRFPFLPPFFSNNKVSLERITSLARSRRINLINSFRIARSSFLYRRRSLSTEPFRTSQISLRPGPNNINHTERWRIRLGSARNLYPIQAVRTYVYKYIYIYIYTRKTRKTHSCFERDGRWLSPRSPRLRRGL